MRLFSSLTNRIFVASALLAVVSIALGIYKFNAAVTAQAEDELLRGLADARTMIEEHRRSQVEHFTLEARLIADLPRLKAAVGEADAATASGVVVEYQQQLAADLFMVTDRRGRVLARLPEGGLALQVERMSGVRRAVAGQETNSFVSHDGGILQLVSVPIWILTAPDAPEILGTLNIGFSLNWRAADRFRSLTNSDIAFGVGGRVQTSTLPPDAWASLTPLLARDGLSKQVLLEGGDYIATTVPLAPEVDTDAPQPASLRPSAGAAKAIILRSRSERLAFLKPLHSSMFVLAGFAVLAATVLSYGIARTVTRPLGVITATMRDMTATGDLTRRIPIPVAPLWEDEDARLLAATFNTMTDSIARFQREAAQRERLSALGRLSTVVAHEIRNPLMIIKAALRGLRRDGIAPTDVTAAVADIDEEIVRLNRIVSEVLDFARPIRFDLAATDLNALCADAVRASGADGTPLAARMQLDPELPAIVTDAERVRLVLVNLLTNARHALAGRDRAADPEAISITTTRLTGARVAIDVSDRGTGISPEQLPRIFDPYFTTRRTGTGLGLAISRNIVEGLRGTIAISSRTGGGTTVRVELPISPLDELMPARGAILLVDDETKILNAIASAVRADGHDVVAVANPREAQRLLSQRMFDVLVIDNLMPELSGLDLIRELSASTGAAEIPQIVMMTAHATVESAIEAMRLGAFDYLQKPFEIDELLVVVNRALDHQRLRTEHTYLIHERDADFNHYGMVGRSRPMQDVIKTAELVARTKSTVLITGETGTGKELVARAIHYKSAQREMPLIKVNCAAIPETLLESELFGHVRGAFTGATTSKKGKFALADGGSIFLDEIGTMSGSLQAKLLRVLQEREFEPLGSERTQKVDVRVIAATNRDLRQMVADGRFQEDLYYRLNVIPIHIPPLRERREDIPALVEHFITKHAQRAGKRIDGVAPGVLETLRGAEWPGNVRELENTVERAVVLSPSAVIGVDAVRILAPASAAPAGLPSLSLRQNIDWVERETVRRALEAASGVKKDAAETMGISQRALSYYLAKHRVD